MKLNMENKSEQPANGKQEPRDINKVESFCWLEKPALRHIREHSDGISNLDQVLAVYLALAELASNAGAESFTASVRRIADFSGVSPRSIHRCLDALFDRKVIDWEQNASTSGVPLGPSTYTLLALKPRESRKVASAPVAYPSASQAHPSARNEKSIPAESLEQREKNLRKKKEKPTGAALPPELDFPDFKDSWERWAEYRKQAKLKAYTEIGSQAQLTHLAKLGRERAIAAIEHSIRQSHQGIYEPKAAAGGAAPRVEPVKTHYLPGRGTVPVNPQP